jgi:hypothetical protein
MAKQEEENHAQDMVSIDHTYIIALPASCLCILVFYACDRARRPCHACLRVLTPHTHTHLAR